MAKGQIKARIRCTIEIPVGIWGGGTIDLDALTEQVRQVFFVVLAEEL